eukprot:XP_011454265.1 PREDICTED: uncharacterized protein LOC105347071 [Crassostrea gigas]
MFSALSKMFSSFIYILLLCSAYAHQYLMISTVCDLIDINYSFQCGDVSCEGPLQYCSDDNVCLYCSMYLCQSPTPPSQCQLQCKKLQLGNFTEHCGDEMMKQKSNFTKDHESDMHGFCIDIYYFSAFCAVSVVIATIIIITASQLCKKYRARKNVAFVNVNHFHRCCCFSYPEHRKQKATCPSEEMTAICVPSGK